MRAIVPVPTKAHNQPQQGNPLLKWTVPRNYVAKQIINALSFNFLEWGRSIEVYKIQSLSVINQYKNKLSC